MKKALLVTRVSGFVPQHEMNNVKILQEMGYEVHYATDLNNVVYGRDNSRLEGSGITTHQIDFCRSPFSRKVRIARQQLVELMLRERFDLIHCHMPMSAVVARRAARQVRRKTGKEIPVIYTAHGFHFCHGVPLKNWLYFPVEWHYARYTDCLILMNEEDYVRAGRFPIRGRAAKINGVGIDLERFKPYRKKSWKIGEGSWEPDIRRKYHLPDGCILLVTVGELAPAKNHLVALEAIAELGDFQMAYLICGTGRMEKRLKEKVRELHLEERVRFAGYVENIPELLQQSDCFVFPSGREGLPVAVMEAMAVGLPVVAANIRGVNDLLEHMKGGELCRSFSPSEFAVKLRRLFEDGREEGGVPGELVRERMGKWNQERIKDFSIEIVEEQMRSIYSEVIKR